MEFLGLLMGGRLMVLVNNYNYTQGYMRWGFGDDGILWLILGFGRGGALVVNV